MVAEDYAGRKNRKGSPELEFTLDEKADFNPPARTLLADRQVFFECNAAEKLRKLQIRDEESGKPLPYRIYPARGIKGQEALMEMLAQGIRAIPLADLSA